MCRWILGVALGCAITCGGCYASFERAARDGSVELDAGHDAGSRDAGSRDAGSRDAAPDDAPLDAPGIDAGPACAAPIFERPRHLCVLAAQGSIPAGEPFVVPLTYGDCRCDADRTCTVRVEGGAIELGTQSCESGVDCEDCSYELRCELPPLETGTYRMRLDGADVFDVSVEPRRMTRVGRPACYGVQDEVDPRFDCPWPGRPPSAPMVCARALEDVGTEVTITVIDPCASCLDTSAGCETRVEGTTLTVRPHVRTCECASCEGCDASCMERRTRCVSPALRAGEYTVEVQLDGEVMRRALSVRDVTSPGEVICGP